MKHPYGKELPSPYKVRSLLTDVCAWLGDAHTPLPKYVAESSKPSYYLLPSQWPRIINNLLLRRIWHLKKVIFVLPNQTWVHFPGHSKVSLLTAGCGEGKCSVYCRVPK